MIPNEFPSIESSYKLAIVGDSPHQNEQAPFSSGTGAYLSYALQSANAMLSCCFRGHIVQVPCPGDQPSRLHKQSIDYVDGLEKLKDDLQTFSPNCILILGEEALKVAGIKHSMLDFRGSIFECIELDSPFYGYKCVATVNLNRLNINYDQMPLFSFDVQRAVEESRSPILSLPQRNYTLQPTKQEVLDWLHKAQIERNLVSIDIEGRVSTGVSCIGLSTHPLEAIIIPLADWDFSTQAEVMRAFAELMSDSTVPKVLQNSLYDWFVLLWLWRFPILNIQHDTMLSGWELYPELPKGLGVQSSLYTKEPFYKFNRKSDDKLTHYKYCCTDAAVTLEICNRHQELMTPSQLSHYQFNMSLLPALQFMEAKGILIDTESREKLKLETLSERELVKTQMTTLAKEDFNPASPIQLAKLLYQKMGFEPQYKKEHGRKTTSLTTDVDAILNLCKKFNHPFLNLLLKWRKLSKIAEQCEWSVNADNRMRCSYNLVGTETGRLSCSKSVMETGSNLQTAMKLIRKFFVADPSNFFFECDLSGADGWTVAAHSSAEGDDTMLEDYLFGLKPAQILALMWEGIDVKSLSRDSILSLWHSHPTPKWKYFVCKMIQHGTNYGMKETMMSNNILKQSHKHTGEPIYVTPKDCAFLQLLYLSRYRGVSLYQRHIETQIKKHKQLSCASGHTRSFFGRTSDHSTIQAAYSHEPQANTTYATNLAMQKLWLDPQNQDPSGHYIIQPLHSVHDALCGQFPQDRVEFSVNRIRSYFQNPITIRGITLTIPFEGHYGESWGNLKLGQIHE